MPVSRQDVEKIARLAHLEFEPEELERFREQFQRILDYVDQIEAVPTGQVEPTGYPVDPDGVTPLRADEPGPSLPGKAALDNAPESEQDHFQVPPVIE